MAKLTRMHGIIEVIRRRNDRGCRFQDADGILNQQVRQRAPSPGLGDALDAFIDDELGTLKTSWRIR